MQALCILSLIVALAPALPAPSAAQEHKGPKGQADRKEQKDEKEHKGKAKAARTIELTGGDDMKYNLTKIPAKRGETLHIVLKSVGTIPKIAMAHNVVVLKPGTDQNEFSKAGAMARATDFIPAEMKSQVLAATKLAGPGETVDVTFTVPAKAGAYPFMCTFPGHFAAGMKGELNVQ
jgi:azurin